MSHTVRRRLTAGLATLLLTGLAACSEEPQTQPAAPQTPDPRLASAAAWLEGQLEDGAPRNEQYDFDDYGLALDVFFALHALDARPEAQAAVLDRLERDPAAYVAAGGEFAGSYGKLVTAVETAGRDATAFGETDLLAGLEQRVVQTPGEELGRGVDEPEDYSNTIGQSWVVRGLVAAESEWADEGVAFLLKQQCADGWFRGGLESADHTCAAGEGADQSVPSVDATAFALTAMLEAAQAGQPELDGQIEAAEQWLLEAQRSSGAFADEGKANTNTTGLAAGVLVRLGHEDEAAKAADWIARHQLSDDQVSGTPATEEVGAIAYDQPSLKAALGQGIAEEARDQWRRATAQAAVGLVGLPAEAAEDAAA